MDFKKLNETLESFLEDSINEISFETKSSYLAKRKAQLDAAKKAFDKANRLIRNTEMSKKNDAVGEEETLKAILRKVKDSDVKYNDRTFGYIESFKTWAYIQTGDLDSDSGAKHCKITVSFYDGYLIVNIKTNNPWRESKEKFNMSELTTTKLINKASAYILKVLKEKTKQFTKTQKISPKIEKTIEQIKKVLSRAKEDKLEDNKYKESILMRLNINGRREKIIGKGIQVLQSKLFVGHLFYTVQNIYHPATPVQVLQRKLPHTRETLQHFRFFYRLSVSDYIDFTAFRNALQQDVAANLSCAPGRR